jgi:hypothetical protein
MTRGSSRDDVMMLPPAAAAAAAAAGADVHVTAHGTPPLNADNRTVFVGNLGQDIQVEVWQTEPVS